MDVASLLNDKAIKPIEKREQLAEAIKMKIITINEIKSLDGLDERKTGIILEAMEAVTRTRPEWCEEPVSERVKESQKDEKIRNLL